MTPGYKNVASLLLAAKANALGHASMAVRERWLTNGFLILSAVLGYVAGFNGLADLVSKTWVSVIALAAGLSTTIVILALTMLKPRDHQRAQAEYDGLFMRTVGCDLRSANGSASFDKVWDDFISVVHDIDKAGIPLTSNQVSKFAKKARKALPTEDARNAAELPSDEPLERQQG